MATDGPDGPGGEGPDAGDDPASAPVSPSALLSPPTDGTRGAAKRGPSRSLVVGLVAAGLAIGVTVAVVALSASSHGNPLSPGTGTATITWTSAKGNDNPPQPFGGTIDGLPVSGVSTVERPTASTLASGAPGPTTPRIHLFELKGTFDGKSFALGLYIQYHSSPSAAQALTFPDIQVLGTYGNEPVRATLTPPASDLSDPESIDASTPVLFNGTIGGAKVSGRIPFTVSHQGASHSVTATFTVAH
jgi:hypothetical protein